MKASPTLTGHPVLDAAIAERAKEQLDARAFAARVQAKLAAMTQENTKWPVCAANVHRGYGVSFTGCRRTATVTRDGTAYCATHDPENVKARRQRQDAKWRLEREIGSASHALEQARRAAADIVERGEFTPIALEAARHHIQRARAVLDALMARNDSDVPVSPPPV